MFANIAGYKTYIVAGAAGLVWTLEAVNIMPPGIANSAYTGLAVLGSASMAAKVNRLKS